MAIMKKDQFDNVTISRSIFVKWYLKFIGLQHRNVKSFLEKDPIYYIYQMIYPIIHLLGKLLRKYLFDAWNITQLASNILTITLTSILTINWIADEPANDNTSIACAIAAPLSAFEIIYYLGGLPETGPLVRMITKILKGITGVIIILIIMLVAFTFSYSFLYEDTEVYGFEDYSDSFASVFGFLFMGYDLEVLDEAKSSTIARLLMYSFIFYVEIALFNLLIAIMGHIYDETQQNTKAEAAYALAKLTLEYEQTFTQNYKVKNKDSFYPNWLFVLKIKEV